MLPYYFHTIGVRN